MLASSSLARDSACAACALRSSLVGGLNALVCNGCRSSPICATSSRTCTPSSTGPPAGVFGTSCTSRSSRRTIAPGTAPCVLRTDVKHFSSRGVFEGDDGTMGDLSARSNSCSSSSTGGGTGGGFFPPISLLTSSQASVSGASAGGVFTNKNLLDRAQHDFQRRGLIQAFSSLSSCPATSSSSTGASSTGQPPGVEHVILGQGPIPDITSSIGSPSKLTTLSCGGGREPPENGPGRPPEKGKPSSSSSSTGTSTSSPSHPTAASKNTTTSASTIPRSASSSSTSASSADSSSSRSASSNGGMSSNGKNGTNGVSTTFSNGTSNGNGNGKGHRFKASHQAEKSTSLQSKRKLRREQLKNYLNPERVLFTAQGLVLKAKAAGRFTVSKLQNLRKGIVRVCKDPRVLSLWAQDVKDAVKHFIEWNKQGFGLFWLNMKVTRKLLTRRMQGHTLSYRDRQLLVRTTGDVFKLIPFSFFLIIPFAEIALPPVLYFFPGLMPSTFLEKGQENESLVRKLKAKKELAVFFQEVVDANTKEQIFKAASADSEKGMSLEEAQYEFNAFQAKMERGEFPSAQEVVRFSKQFGRWFTFDNLPDDKLRIMADILGLGDSPLFRSHLALRLRHHINRLRREDREIMFEGVDSLSRDDLVELCRARAIPFTADISDEAMREGLRGWLELSAHRQIPVSVLLWVQTYYLTGEGKLEGLDLDKVVETPASLNGTAGSRQSSRGKTAPLGKTAPATTSSMSVAEVLAAATEVPPDMMSAASKDASSEEVNTAKKAVVGGNVKGPLHDPSTIELVEAAASGLGSSARSGSGRANSVGGAAASGEDGKKKAADEFVRATSTLDAAALAEQVRREQLARKPSSRLAEMSPEGAPGEAATSFTSTAQDGTTTSTTPSTSTPTSSTVEEELARAAAERKAFNKARVEADLAAERELEEREREEAKRERARAFEEEKEKRSKRAKELEEDLLRIEQEDKMQRRNSGESDEDVLLKVDAETEALRGVAGESLKNGETSEAGTHSYSCTTAKKEDAWSTSSREVTPGSTTSPSTTQEAGDMSRTTSSSVEMINSSSCTSGSRRNPIEDLDALGEMQRTLSYGRNIQDTGYDTVSQEELSQRIRKTTESFIDEINSPGRKALSAGVSRTELIDRLARDTREMGHLRGIIDRQADLLQAQLDALIRIREASTHLLSNAEMTGHVEQLERLHLDQKVRIHEAVSHFSSGLRDIEEEYRMWGAEDNAIDSMKTPDTVTAVGQGRQQQELHQGESSSVLRETSDRTEEKMKNSDVGEKK